MAKKMKMPKMRLPKKGIFAMPAVRVILMIVLVVVIVIALVRAGFLPGQYGFSLSGSTGAEVEPSLGGLSVPLSFQVGGSAGAGYKLMGNREGFQAEGEMRMVWFHRKNCPHCVAMKEEWAKFVKDMAEMHPDIVVVDYDGDTEEGRKNFPEDITGVPAIRLYKGDQMMEHSGPRTAEAMMEFVHQNLKA